MNNIWSEYVQGMNTLYLSKLLRFDDMFRPQYEPLFNLDKDAKLRILEIGCGPGALAGALHRWYPKAEITALDRDSNFIAFAKEHVPGVDFLEGDATALPFADGVFDVVISNTVAEHVEPAIFYTEQRRILKKGGICLVLSARRGIYQTAECLKRTKDEEDFWASAEDYKEKDRRYSVCRYPMSEQEMPIAMEANGFTRVSTGYAIINLTPDSDQYPAQMAEKMIEAQRHAALDSVRLSGPDKESIARISELVNEKYDTRLRLYREGKKQWDTAVSVTLVMRGVVPSDVI